MLYLRTTVFIGALGLPGGHQIFTLPTVMTSIPSATLWGSLTARKHALLIHGLTSSSHTWHTVASSLAAQGMSHQVLLDWRC